MTNTSTDTSKAFVYTGTIQGRDPGGELVVFDSYGSVSIPKWRLNDAETNSHLLHTELRNCLRESVATINKTKGLRIGESTCWWLMLTVIEN